MTTTVAERPDAQSPGEFERYFRRCEVTGLAIHRPAEQLIRRLGTAWAFRVTGFLTLATGLPAAWLLRERSPRRRTTFIE